jgi:hypothetical protein
MGEIKISSRNGLAGLDYAILIIKTYAVGVRGRQVASGIYYFHLCRAALPPCTGEKERYLEGCALQTSHRGADCVSCVMNRRTHLA